MSGWEQIYYQGDDLRRESADVLSAA